MFLRIKQSVSYDSSLTSPKGHFWNKEYLFKWIGLVNPCCVIMTETSDKMSGFSINESNLFEVAFSIQL